MLSLILFYSFIGSVVSLSGGLILALKKKPFTHHQSLLLISFAAGVLLATAFFDLLPEGLALMTEIDLTWAVIGAVFLFCLEKFLIWYHHHDQEHHEHGFTALMITIGDTVHNFVDGVVIAGATLSNPVSGLVTALAVGAHEVPHEIADFGVLLSKGWSKKKVIMINFISAFSAVAGAVVMLYIGTRFADLLPKVLTFSGGLFIYLACSDLIPELHHEHGQRQTRSIVVQTLVFILGILVVWGLINLLEG